MPSESTSITTGSSQQGMMKDVEKGTKKEEEARLIPHTEAYEKKFGPYWHGTCFDRIEAAGKRWATKPEDL